MEMSAQDPGAEALKGLPIDPAVQVTSAWHRAKPAVQSILRTAAVVCLTALFMVALPLFAVALLLLAS